jgi:hypothetical protein
MQLNILPVIRQTSMTILLLSCCTLSVLAQKASYDLPMLNHVYVLKDGQPVALEKKIAGLRTKMKAMGYGGASAMMQIDGKASPVRLSASAPQRFVLNTGGAAPDFVLYTAKSKKDSRQAESMKVGMGGMKTGKNILSFSVAQLGNGVYELTPDQTLEAGEYFFTERETNNGGTVNAFAFGID